ncbi:MAG TPA: hypothetical protein VM582_08610, partial [Candidatus Thermoplasmatota archaeon]|nr:hypothetical protein [Candidatus Thermoplasmatota archaeon]
MTSVLPAPALPPNMHPKQLADGLALAYDAIMALDVLSDEHKATLVSGADALFYNLHVTDEDRGLAWSRTNVPMGSAAAIDLDGDNATGLDGNDLVAFATLTPAHGALGAAALDANETAPTLRVQAVGPAARHRALFVCAYFQLPHAPYVAAACVDTRNATLDRVGARRSGGFPDSVNVTMRAHAFGDDASVVGGLTLQAHRSGGEIPLVALASSFQVDPIQRAKPRLPHGNHAEAMIRA